MKKEKQKKTEKKETKEKRNKLKWKKRIYNYSSKAHIQHPGWQIKYEINCEILKENVYKELSINNTIEWNNYQMLDPEVHR